MYTNSDRRHLQQSEKLITTGVSKLLLTGPIMGLRELCPLVIRTPMLSNHPGGARIGTKIPDWMSSNLAGREN